MKHLTLRPQKLVDDYLQGKRKEIFNPVSFLIIVVTLFLIWDAMHRNGVEKTGHEKPYEMGHKTAQFILEYFKYFWLLSIAWLGFGTRILFRKLSLAEHFAIKCLYYWSGNVGRFVSVFGSSNYHYCKPCGVCSNGGYGI